MGRHKKLIFSDDGVERRQLGYYSTPQSVATFLAKKCLEINPFGRSVFDPCIGKGELVSPFLNRNVFIEGLDIINWPLPKEVAFTQMDFFRYYANLRSGGPQDGPNYLLHDFIVVNPPYNCHEVDYIRENKEWLKTVFIETGVLNLYSMFLWALIDLAKDGAVIAAITHDSFLTAIGHAALREKIFNSCSLHYLILAPTDLFLSQGADVRTCIMILKKGKSKALNIKIANRASNRREFEEALARDCFEEVPEADLRLNMEKDFGEFVIGVPQEIRSLFAYPRLGELFPCITGISTGNDKKYLRKTIEDGYTVPFYKNPGNRKYFSEPDGYLIDEYLEEAKRTRNFIVRNKDKLAKGGIACSSMGVPFSAVLLPEGAMVGVNPTIIVNEADRWWLLGYLNSSLVTYLVRGVLARSNMITSGYASRIPIPAFSDQLKDKLSLLAQEAYKKRKSVESVIYEIDEIVSETLHFSSDTLNLLRTFCNDLLRLT